MAGKIGNGDLEQMVWQALRTLVATGRTYPDQMGDEERALMFHARLMHVQPDKALGGWRWKWECGAILLFDKIRLDLAIERDLLLEKLTGLEAA